MSKSLLKEGCFLPIIDFHTHILPYADHGSDSVETSLAQLKLIKAAGVDSVVATPHFYPHQDNLKRFLERRERAIEKLLQKKIPDAPRIFAGAEVAVCPHLERLGEEGLSSLCVEGTRTILLEMPASPEIGGYLEAACEIREMGFSVVLAHIDRYPFKEALKWVDAGFSVQLNATAFRGLFRNKKLEGETVRNATVAYGSDLHGAGTRAYRAFAELAGRKESAEIFARTEMLLSGATPIIP